MKKTLAALALALALLTVPAAAFSDVDSGLYYAAPIAWAVEQGITTGTTESTFSPDAYCTRGQIITFLWRAAGSPAPKTGTSPFTDVTESLNPDFYKAILWAYETGITGEGSQFLPNALCDRGTTMAFLWRYAGSPDAGVSDSFTDVPSEEDYAKAVAWAVKSGITSGTTDTTFSPGEVCTRGQIATFLYRCLNDDARESAQQPETPPVTQPSSGKTDEEAHPLRTLTGDGRACSMGLDGSEFTSEEVYDAKVTVDIYSPYEAVFTINVPFPLFQACSYSVRFEDPDDMGSGYLFTCLRWDEAFADMLPWEGEHRQYLFTDMSGNTQGIILVTSQEEEDRMEGSISWRVGFLNGLDFNYDMLNGYHVSCEASANLPN